MMLEKKQKNMMYGAALGGVFALNVGMALRLGPTYGYLNAIGIGLMLSPFMALFMIGVMKVMMKIVPPAKDVM